MPSIEGGTSAVHETRRRKRSSDVKRASAPAAMKKEAGVELRLEFLIFGVKPDGGPVTMMSTGPS